LASRLCNLAKDAQILADPTIAGRVRDSIPLASLGQRNIKGYDQALEVFAVAPADLPLKAPGSGQRRREKEPQDH
jgi:class 3 adenylate cyclase